MAINLTHPETGRTAEAKDQAQYDRLFKPAGWQKADPSADSDNAGLAQRVAALEARIEELEAALTAPPEPPDEPPSDEPMPPVVEEAGAEPASAEDETEDAPKRRRGAKAETGG